MAHVHDGEGELPSTIGRTFAVGIALNVGFVIIEGLYGWRAGSLALLADAFHNLSDVGGLLLAWAGLAAGRLASNDRHTYQDGDAAPSSRALPMPSCCWWRWARSRGRPRMVWGVRPHRRHDRHRRRGDWCGHQRRDGRALLPGSERGT